MPPPVAARSRACVPAWAPEPTPVSGRFTVVPAAAPVVLLPAVALTSCRRCRRGRRRRRRCPSRQPCVPPGPGVLREMASPPPLPCVTRVVVPVRLFVTRAVWAHWSPRCTEVEPQLP
ncbi:MAG: hypothetical protein MZV64_05135 [Ignavibacteriales bacterium]|nr:hypothetical protein [Ignavibacteriales bacterium]